MTTDRLGLYLHIPYCVRKCNYCDFCSLPSGCAGVPDEYVARLCEEIESYIGKAGVPLDTVYFGGGTPSLLQPRQMREIFEAIRKTFVVSEGAEITFEANPGTLTLPEYDSISSHRRETYSSGTPEFPDGKEQKSQ